MNAPQLLHRSSAMGQYGRPSQQQLGFLFSFCGSYLCLRKVALLRLHVTAQRDDVTSSHDVSMSTVPQRRPLTTGSDVAATQDGGADAAEGEEEEEPSLCYKKDLRTVASSLPWLQNCNLRPFSTIFWRTRTYYTVTVTDSLIKW